VTAFSLSFLLISLLLLESSKLGGLS
jgi:hypothetical protein